MEHLDATRADSALDRESGGMEVNQFVYIVAYAYDDFATTGLSVMSIHLTKASALRWAEAASKDGQEIRQYRSDIEVIDDSMAYGALCIYPFPIADSLRRLSATDTEGGN